MLICMIKNSENASYLHKLNIFDIKPVYKLIEAHIKISNYSKVIHWYINKTGMTFLLHTKVIHTATRNWVSGIYACLSNSHTDSTGVPYVNSTFRKFCTNP